MGKKRLAAVDATTTPPSVKPPQSQAEVTGVTQITQPKDTKATPPRKVKVRSARYRQVLTQIDRTKTYSLKTAISLLKQVSLAKFDASVEAHLNLTETGLKVTVAFPHSTGKKLRVAIADAQLLDQIQTGNIDFDVLLAPPQIMPQIAKVAKILGPKGLMPNPKTGTVTADPDKKKAELESGSRLISAELKAPLMHTVIGKLSFKDADLIANLKALIATVTPRRITKLTLASTMSPGIKIDLNSLDN